MATIQGWFDYATKKAMKEACGEAEEATQLHPEWSATGKRLHTALELETDDATLRLFASCLAARAVSGRMTLELSSGAEALWPGDWLDGPADEAERPPTHHDRAIQTLCASPDGSLLATAEVSLAFGRVRVFDRATLELRWVFASGENEGGFGDNLAHERLAWLDSDRLIAGLGSRICVLDVRSGELLRGSGRFGTSLLRAHGGRVWVAAPEGGVAVLSDRLVQQQCIDAEAGVVNGLSLGDEGPITSSFDGVTWWQYGDKPRVLSKESLGMEGSSTGNFGILERAKRGGLTLRVFTPGRRTPKRTVHSSQCVPRLSLDGERVWTVEGGWLKSLEVATGETLESEALDHAGHCVLERDARALAIGPQLVVR